MKPLPYVRYDPKAALVESLELTDRADLAARRLRDWIWRHQQAPRATRRALAAITRLSPDDWPAVAAELRNCGWHSHHGRFLSPWVLRVLRDSLAAHRYWSRKASAAAQVRWGADTPPPTPAPPDAQSNAQALLRQCHVKAKAKSTLKDNSSLKRSPGDSPRKSDGPEIERPEPPATPAQARSEADFLGEVAALCNLHRPGSAARELQLWGGWWRLRFREDPDKCRTILADVQSMIRERRLTGRPGAACVDLWHRLPTKDQGPMTVDSRLKTLEGRKSDCE